MKNNIQNLTMSADTTPECLGKKDLANSIATLKSIDFLEWLPPSDVLAFSETYKTARDMSAEARLKHALEKLLTAMVCGKEDLPRKIVTSRPELLLDASAAVTDLSGKEIKGLTPLQAAICAGDVDMVQMIQEVFFQKILSRVPLSVEPNIVLQNQFEAIYSNGNIDAVVTAQKVKAQEFKTSELRAIFTALNTATIEELIFEAENPGQHTDSQLNKALHKFRREFAATSNQELIFNPFYLLKAFEFHDDEYDNFNYAYPRGLFWDQVIGYIQRHLPACYLQALAQGIYYIVVDGEKLERRFEFRYGEELNIPSILGNPDTLGYKFGADAYAGSPVAGRWPYSFFKSYCEQKNQVWSTYEQRLRQGLPILPADRVRNQVRFSCCNIS